VGIPHPRHVYIEGIFPLGGVGIPPGAFIVAVGIPTPRGAYPRPTGVRNLTLNTSNFSGLFIFSSINEEKRRRKRRM